jgi:hypothetical protein
MHPQFSVNYSLCVDTAVGIFMMYMRLKTLKEYVENMLGFFFAITLTLLMWLMSGGGIFQMIIPFGSIKIYTQTCDPSI